MQFNRADWESLFRTAVGKLNIIKNAGIVIFSTGVEWTALKTDFTYSLDPGHHNNIFMANWFNTDIHGKNDFWLTKKNFDIDLYNSLDDRAKIIYRLSLYLWLLIHDEWI